MKQYRCENWKMEEIAYSMKNNNGFGKKIVVPMFQRGKRWDPEKRKLFIDSLIKGYPVGSLLFADQGDREYSVIDGLQRCTSICEYILNPTQKKNLKSVNEKITEQCRKVLFPNSLNITIDKHINDIIIEFITKHKNFDEIEVGEIAERIITEIPTNLEFQTLWNKIKSILKPWFIDYKKDYEIIKQTEIPIIIYSGNNTLLNDIFRRINEQGERLNEYEIFAASWSQDKYAITNENIIEYVIKKYDCLALEDYDIQNYNSDEIRKNKKLTAFEYLFGLGKFLNNFECLSFEKNQKYDKVNGIGFELVDACLNNNKNISNLDKKLKNININLLERKIKEAIEFVSNAIAPISKFKGNNRKIKLLHPKYFILALISFTFREMYDLNNLNDKKLEWEKNQKHIANQILQHYVFQLVKNLWHDGGIGKMYTSIKERAFLEDITKKNWDSLLDNYFDQSLMIKQKQKFSSPSNADVILLNCIYANIFTAHDQLSNQFFDIEHLATKERMKTLIEKSGSIGLPVSSIGNLCYLPEKINRKKKKNTIYEETDLGIAVEDIEKRYSFTEKQDFDWIYLPYQIDDEKFLEEEFVNFLYKRFQRQKEKIYNYLNIE